MDDGSQGRRRALDTTVLPRSKALLKLTDGRFVAIQFEDGEILSVSGPLIERVFGITRNQWIVEGLQSGAIEMVPTGIRYPNGDALGIFFELQCSRLWRSGLLA